VFFTVDQLMIQKILGVSTVSVNLKNGCFLCGHGCCRYQHIYIYFAEV
jgi:hypothetical protein